MAGDTIPLHSSPGERPEMWADSSQSGPNASSWQSFFFRCFRKSMWWKGSFPPKPRWRLCCSFCLGGSINLHPDLVHAAALQHGSLMRSTSPMMEALPRLHQISKTDTPVPLTPTGGEARHQCCPLMQSNVCFLDSPLHCRPCQRTLCRPPWRNPGVSGVNIYLFSANLKARRPRNGKVRMESICTGKGEALKVIGWNSIILLHLRQICYSWVCRSPPIWSVASWLATDCHPNSFGVAVFNAELSYSLDKSDPAPAKHTHFLFHLFFPIFLSAALSTCKVTCLVMESEAMLGQLETTSSWWLAQWMSYPAAVQG